ncbi:MAG TPA: epoxide hydrolase [Rhodanobacteraceae bacterium]
MITPFRIAVPDAALDDLHARLAATRWAALLPDADWRYGADPVYLRALCAYWRDGFDWRAREAALNAFPQYLASIDGLDIHFIHARGKGPDPLPLIVTHGWPSTFAEFTKLIPLLTDPVAYGGRAEDSFDVVAPSLPGYGFSGMPQRPGTTSRGIARLWLALMHSLGYDAFVAHGGDIGAGVTNHLGRIGGGHVRAIHVMAAPYDVDRESPSLSDAEREYVDVLEAWEREEGAYEHQQRTRPHTLSLALNDSPAGLAAWIIEKWRSWSDCGGDVESSFSKDELLTNVSIYWLGATIGSSAQIYYDSAHAGLPRPPRIGIPARLFLSRETVNRCPREWAARSYANPSYGLAPAGGHFMSAERPDLLAADLRDWFRRFRTCRGPTNGG